MKKAYQLWLNQAVDGDVRLYRALVERFGDEERAFGAAKRGEVLSGKEKVMARICALAREAEPEQVEETLDRAGIQALTPDEVGYPALLREIYDPPAVLYVKGRLPPEPLLPLGMVGSRRCTAYGREVARRLAGELARLGACIVSGMAYGIDAEAANAALSAEDNPCPTVAVLGSGVDMPYPKSHERLYREILERGAAVSEFPPGTKPYPSHFPQRNRVISGLSRGVVVVEAGERSGTSITANFALEQGRDLFAVPGRITDSMSLGANRMIREGMAKPVFCLEDILEEYGLERSVPEAERREEQSLSPRERAVVALLEGDPLSFDELCVRMGLPVPELNSALTSLEFSGIIKQLPGRLYSL